MICSQKGLSTAPTASREIYLDDLEHEPAPVRDTFMALCSSDEIHAYVLEMTQQLAHMARLAGRFTLADNLSFIAMQAKAKR